MCVVVGSFLSTVMAVAITLCFQMSDSYRELQAESDTAVVLTLDVCVML